MTLENLTIIITTFKSYDVIKPCIESIDAKVKILVIENSNDSNFKNEIEKKYKNVLCILTGENIGYAKSNNLGLSKVKTKYALILNPDTIIKKNSLENFLITASQHPNFSLIGPFLGQENKFLKNNNDKVKEVNSIKGFAIFLNINKFNDDFFDENYFLYFEEIDLCKKVIKENGKIFLDTSIEIEHKESKSVSTNNSIELEKNRNWHWMWSTFYFHKKHFGFFIALIKIFPKLVSALLKFLFYYFFKKNDLKEIYFSRLSGIINSILGRKSWYRPSLD